MARQFSAVLLSIVKFTTVANKEQKLTQSRAVLLISEMFVPYKSKHHVVCVNVLFSTLMLRVWYA